ncbi:5'-3' exonuclease H3TH domain-containing protein [Salinifilum aidingensis]
MLVDSAGLWFRSYYALPDSLTAPDGTPVNAVRGFCDMLGRLLTEQRPARVVACLDEDWRPAFRVAALPSYKAHRVAEEDAAAEEVPDALGPQIPVILEVLAAAGIATAEAQGYEADDVIGTLAERERSAPVDVVTGDRDLFQLVRAEPSPVRVRYVGAGLSKAQDYGPAELAERYGLTTARAGADYADVAVLRGDPSDGLPGVAGVGEKTAARLITEFGSLEALLAAAGGPAPARASRSALTPRLRAKLAEAAEYLAAAPSVVRVVRDADAVVDRDDALSPTAADDERLDELKRQWGLGGSIDRLREALRACT